LFPPVDTTAHKVLKLLDCIRRYQGKRTDFNRIVFGIYEQQPFVTSTIIGASTLEQLKKILIHGSSTLSDEILKAIDEVQAVIPDPHRK
jgi:aryl-alcohol dehydrogenase-like predicted oxidoreductase